MLFVGHRNVQITASRGDPQLGKLRVLPWHMVVGNVSTVIHPDQPVCRVRVMQVEHRVLIVAYQNSI